MIVTVSAKAKKQLDKIPDKVFLHIMNKILALVKKSPNLSIRKLTNRDGSRLRVGDYRVIYKVTVRELQVLSVAHRKDAYRN